MGVLDTLLGSPTFAAGAGLLAAGQGGQTTGAGLLTGLQSFNQARQAQQQQLLGGLRATALQQAIDAAQRREASRERIQGIIGQPEQAQTVAGPPSLSGVLPQQVTQEGAGILGGQIPLEQGLLQAASLSEDPLTATTGLLNAFKSSQTGTETERMFAELQDRGAITQGEADQLRLQILQRKAQGDPSDAAQIVEAFLKAQQKTAATKLETAKDESIREASRLASFESQTNNLIGQVLQPGATVGFASQVFGGLETVRSQLQQLSDGNFASLSSLPDTTRKAILAGEITSGELSLAYTLASAREEGKLTDKDIQIAKDTFKSNSIPVFVAKLIKTRNDAVNSFNAKQKVNRQLRGDDRAFSDFTPSQAFTPEIMTNLTPDQALQIIQTLPKSLIKRTMSPEAARILFSKVPDGR